MPNITRWKNANIEIRSQFTPKRLWLAATIDVLLNQKMILSTGGKLKLNGACVEPFDYEGEQHQVRLEWGKFLLNSVPCTLYIDDNEIKKETVRIGNLPLNLVAILILCIFLFPFLFAFFYTVALVGNIVIRILTGA